MARRIGIETGWFANSGLYPVSRRGNRGVRELEPDDCENMPIERSRVRHGFDRRGGPDGRCGLETTRGDGDGGGDEQIRRKNIRGSRDGSRVESVSTSHERPSERHAATDVPQRIRVRVDARWLSQWRNRVTDIAGDN